MGEGHRISAGACRARPAGAVCMFGGLALGGTAACGRLGFDASPPVAELVDAPGASGDGAPGGPIPIHEYGLANSYADDHGGPALVSLGGTLSAGGYRFAADAGLTLIGAMPPSVYTVDLTFSFDTLGSWRKILDFKSLSSDNGLYTFDQSLQFVVVAGTTFATSAPLLAAQTSMRITLSRNAAGMVAGSVNGAQVIAFDDAAAVGALDAGAIASFFIDDGATGGGEASGGVVRRIRIYDAALDASTLGP